LRDAEARFLKGSPGPMKDKALAALIKVVDPSRVPRLLRDYQRIGDEDDLARLRFAVAPYLGANALLSDIAKEGKTQRIRSLAKMMEELVGALTEPQLRSFVAAATELVADWWVVEALSDVLLKVDDSSAINRILNAAGEIGPPDLRSRLAVRAVQRLAKLGRVDVALATTIRVELEAERWRGLTDTAESLAAVERFNEAVLVASAVADREERGRAQALVSLYQAGYGYLERGLILAGQIQSKIWRDWALAHLSKCPAVPPVRKTGTALGEKSVGSVDEDRCEKILFEKAKREPWAALSNYIHAGQSGRDLTGFWREPIPPSQKYFLDYFDTELRRDFLEEMRCLVPVVAKYGTKDDLVGIDRATRDIGRWWR
jgi:hypothetical protein